MTDSTAETFAAASLLEADNQNQLENSESQETAVFAGFVESSETVETVDSELFSSFGLDERLMQALDKLKFSSPTPIQAQAIPVAMQGRDIMGLAHTGTGKTAAFVIPIINKLLTVQGKGIRALIVAPTRELVEQIASVVHDLGSRARIQVTTVYGGASMGRQIAELRRKPEVVVACPGRLLDHIQRRTIDLSSVQTLVLDEADQMFDMGFLPNIKKIITFLPEDYQSLLFSATMPDSIKDLATEMMTNPEVIKASQGAVSAPSVTHSAYIIPHAEKTNVLMRLLNDEPDDTVLIFTRTKHGAQNLAEKVDKAGLNTVALHGNLSQAQRLRALAGFRKGQYRILVATDVAARGLDISGIGRVINFEMPQTVESYVHRSGRTGRASQEGRSISLISPHDRTMLRSIERVIQVPVERAILEGITISETPQRSGSGAGGRTRQRERVSGGRDNGGAPRENRKRFNQAPRGRTSDDRRQPRSDAPRRESFGERPWRDAPNREEGNRQSASSSNFTPRAPRDNFSQNREQRGEGRPVRNYGERSAERSGERFERRSSAPSSFSRSAEPRFERNGNDAQPRTPRFERDGNRSSDSRGPRNDNFQPRERSFDRAPQAGADRDSRPSWKRGPVTQSEAPRGDRFGNGNTDRRSSSRDGAPRQDSNRPFPKRDGAQRPFRGRSEGSSSGGGAGRPSRPFGGRSGGNRTGAESRGER